MKLLHNVKYPCGDGWILFHFMRLQKNKIYITPARLNVNAFRRAKIISVFIFFDFFKIFNYSD